MNSYKILNLFLVVSGAIIVALWMIVDIFSTEKINPVYAVIGLLVSMLGTSELNHMKLMETLNEPPKPI